MLSNVLARFTASGREALRAKAIAEAASAHFDAGKMAEAEACCRQALAIDADQNLAHKVLAKTLLPGPTYLEVLERLHGRSTARTYLEVGVDHGHSIVLAGDKVAIGIDPAPEIERRLGARTKIFRETSDQFFAARDVRAELQDLPIDLAFIDGMHKFEFAFRDFINIEKHSSSSTIVLIHDCYPLDEMTARRDRVTAFWSGDIWRLIIALKKYRPDLRVHTIGASPTGLGMITGLDPRSTVLSEQYDRIVEDMLATTYESLDAGKEALLSFVPNEWARIEALLP